MPHLFTSQISQFNLSACVIFRFVSLAVESKSRQLSCRSFACPLSRIWTANCEMLRSQMGIAAQIHPPALTRSLKSYRFRMETIWLVDCRSSIYAEGL